MQIAVSNTSMYEPPAAMVKEAQRRMNEVIRLGTEAAHIRAEQIEHIRWFESDPDKHYAAAGYPGGLMDMIRDPEVSKALWGNVIEGHATAWRCSRMLRVQLSLTLDEVEIFEVLPKSITSTGMMSVVEDLVKALPAPADPARPEAVAELREKLETIGGQTHKTNRATAKQALIEKAPFDFNGEHGIVKYSNGHGPRPVLKLTDEAGALGAMIVARLIRPNYDSLYLDGDTLTAWVNGQPVIVGKVLTTDDHELNVLADAVKATRRTS